ncbi:hypothetical protein [Streptomyces sp. NPDC005408]|uniref:hypothetical protein n=1 Tax=Streptomyces sp. NPDC005408 TaxID=3155341 RepID=UPI0033AD497A
MRLLLVPALAASLLGTPVTAQQPPDRARAIADRLARDPLYVDPAGSAQLKAPVQAQLRKRLGTSKVPIYVVVTPSNHHGSDPYEGDPEVLLAFVHDRLRRDGVYVTADEDGDDLVAQEYGVERDAETAALLGEYGDPLRVSLPRFVDAVATGTAEERYEKENGWDDEGEDGGSGLSGLSRWTCLAGLGALLLAGLGYMAYLLRKGS